MRYLIDYSKFYSKLSRSIKASEIRELLAIIKEKKDVISFAGGIPDPRLFPKKELAEIAYYVVEKYGDYALQYSETKGIREARTAICKLLEKARNIKCEPEDLIITTGSQSALDIVARALIDPEDIVFTESPSYLAALGAFKNAGAKLIGVKIDDEGMDTYLLEDMLKKISQGERERVKFLYTIPIAQNPAGVTMNLERRKHLLEIASRYDFLILEDDPYGYLVFEKDIDTTPLKALDKEDRVIYLGTVSKILAPGLRIGWILANHDLTRKFELLKQYIDLHAPTLNQYIVAEAVERGLIDAVVQRALPHYKTKRDAMLDAINEYLPDYIWSSKPVGGLFIFIYVFKQGFDAGAVLPRAINEYKIAYVPGKSFHPDGSGANSMRLNFSYPTIEQIHEGIKRLGELIKES
ncbi:MAG: PLP-dependent aminotransferase family protein [Desulfurococcaceae archaeon]